jgi:hypothetical protein
VKLALLAAWPAALGVLGLQAPEKVAGLAGDAPRDPLQALAAREPVAGLAGFQSQSVLTFDVQPDVAQRLEATYVFPSRARWWMTAPNARDAIYRCGELFYELMPGQGTSVELGDPRTRDERWRATCQGLELRRALFQWPDGFSWSGEGQARTAKSDCGAELVATLGPDGRPVEVAAVGGAGDESLRKVTWREHRGRWWPSTLELHHGGARVWSERVERVDTQLFLLDLFFLPPDRRPAPASQAAMLAQVRHGDLAEGYALRLELEPASRWGDLAARWDELARAHAKGAAGAWRPEPGAWVELAGDGSPAALVLRFQPGEGDPPEGLERARERSALVVVLNGVGLDFAAALAALREAVPPAARAGTAYARFRGAPSPDGPAQVLLAVEAAK